MIEIDGSRGEGGGQILRTSLALSMITGRAFRIGRIRANRPKPGLMRQHLTCVRAACEVSGGQAEGAELGSEALVFTPGAIRAGAYAFAIGTAGSTTLVLQTVLPALMSASGPSTLTLSGGTHNLNAPSVHFLSRAFLPLLARMGPGVEIELRRHGFFPAGGGEVVVTITPADRLHPIELVETTPIVARRAVATVAGLPGSIALRELAVVGRKLEWLEEERHVEQVRADCGPGNVLSLEIEREDVCEVFTGFGERGVSAERVATRAIRDARRYLKADVPVWGHLADQIMLPMAIAGGGAFTTGQLTPHATTNAGVIEQFGIARVRCERADADGSQAGEGERIRVSIDS